jgi:hypothetical protein
VRLPRTPKSSAGTAGTSTHTPVGRVGAQLYPGGIAAVYRNTPHGLARPIGKRADETIPNDKRDRAPQQPIAASFGAAVLYRGFNHWYRFPYAFLPCYRTRPAGGGPLLDCRGRLPPNAAPPASVLPSSFFRPSRRPGARSRTPPGCMAPRGAVPLRTIGSSAGQPADVQPLPTYDDALRGNERGDQDFCFVARAALSVKLLLSAQRGSAGPDQEMHAA